MPRMAFRETADVARRSAWLVVVPVVLAALVALVLSLLSTPMYRATADVLVAGADDGVDRVVATELVVASGSELLSEVRAVVGDEPELSVAVAGDADVLAFTASSTNAENAATAANAHADVYVGRAPGAEVVDRAVRPSDPYEPDVVGSVLWAALAGLVIGVVAALIVGWRDPTVRSERQLARLTGVANLAVIPRHPLGEVRPDDVAVLRDPNSIESEAYRTLRTVLDFVAHDRPFTVLLVTSPRPGEGKSSVAANLAATVAQLGRRVVLVDGDLRRPQIHRLFVTGNQCGLSSVLTGEAPLQQGVQRLDRDHNIALLTAGPPPPDPAELLSHERLRRTLESLAGGSDFVVVDAPPVLPVADPIILAQAADATLLVATAGLSDRREWTETVDRLRKVDAHVVGTVLLRPDSRVHATPSYRYAPSAAPAHWWVTEASRRAGSAPEQPPAAEPERLQSAEPETVADDVDLPVDDAGGEAPTVAAVPEEASVPAEPVRSVDEYSWGRRVAVEDLAWQDPVDADVDGSEHGDGAAPEGSVDHGAADAQAADAQARTRATSRSTTSPTATRRTATSPTATRRTARDRRRRHRRRRSRAGLTVTTSRAASADAGRAMATATRAGPMVGSNAPVRATATAATPPISPTVHRTTGRGCERPGRWHASTTSTSGQKANNAPTMAECRPVAP
jgi:polysaccharide biosynthesis transport protein